MAPGYLATLPTTGSRLAALQQAHRAKLAILAKSKPVRQQTLALASLIPGSFQGGQKLTVHEVVFDTAGQYAAVSLTCRGESTHDRDMHDSVTACVIFNAADGYKEQACICGSPGSSEVRIRWASDAPLLTVARQLPQDVQGSLSPEQSALLVLDATTATVVHALGPQNEALLRQAYKPTEWMSQLELSPSGRMLLVSSCCWGPPLQHVDHERRCQGSLWVFDVFQDKLLLQDSFRMVVPGHEEQRISTFMGLVAWHPSSQGLVFSHCVELQRDGDFGKAGLEVEILPEPCYLNIDNNAGFSPDGQLLAVSVLREPDLPYYMVRRPEYKAWYGILERWGEGEGMDMYSHREYEHDLEYECEEYTCQWLPCSSKILFGLACGQCRLVTLTDIGIGKQDPIWQKTHGSPPVHFSPSGQLMTMGSTIPNLLHTYVY